MKKEGEEVLQAPELRFPCSVVKTMVKQRCPAGNGLKEAAFHGELVL